MKKRKAAIAGFLLAAVMGISVGYAAVSTVLDFTGNITVSEQTAMNTYDDDIYFKEIIGTPTNCTAQINSDNNDKITMSVEGLKAGGDTATVTAKIVNVGDITSKIKVRSVGLTGTNASDFTVTTNWGDESKDLAALTGEIEITITVTLNNDVTGLTTASFAVELQADSVN